MKAVILVAVLATLAALTTGTLVGLATRDYTLARACALPLAVVIGVVGGLESTKNKKKK